jgi:hypothetical protein
MLHPFVKRTIAVLVFSSALYAIGEYDYTKYRVDPSPLPPGGLDVSQVPQFVTIGFDDNMYSGDEVAKSEVPTVIEGTEGMRWLLNFFKDLKNQSGNNNAGTFDNFPARVTFYMTGNYQTQSANSGDNPGLIRNITRELWKDGHEIGNHTQTHNVAWNPNSAPDQAGWENEMNTCNGFLTKPIDPADMPYYLRAESADYGAGIPLEDIVGFRTPFLIVDNPTFKAMKNVGFTYDCSIEEGVQYDQPGTEFNWPYTLNSKGSDAWPIIVDNSIESQYIPEKHPMESHDGLWELPNHVAIIPPDDKCADYGLSYSLRDKIKATLDWFDTEDGKYTMFDVNFWNSAKLNDADVLATLKYNLDLRLSSNRAPLMIGAHSENYTSKTNASFPNVAVARDRQVVLEEFIKYALSKPEVRVVRGRDIIEWCMNPVALNDIHYRVKTNVPKDTIAITSGCSEADWDAEKRYDKPDILVSYDGFLYKSLGWNYENVGITPDSDGALWKNMGPCGGYEINEGGTITASVESELIKKGSSVTYTFTPSNEYKLAQIKVDGKVVAKSNTYTISNIDNNHTIEAQFSKDGTVEMVSSKAVKTSSITILGQSQNGIFLSVPTAGQYRVSLYSLNGRLLHSGTAELTRAGAYVPFGSKLAAGYAIVRITGNGVMHTQKISLD